MGVFMACAGFLFLVSVVEIVSETISDYKAKKQRKEAYIKSLEKTVSQQERALQHYRFDCWLKSEA